MNSLSAEPHDEDDLAEVTIVLGMKKAEWNRLAPRLYGPAPAVEFSLAVADVTRHTRRALWACSGITLH